MFGLFKSKASPEEIGAAVARAGITYTEPVIDSLLKLRSQCAYGLSETEPNKALGYAILLSAGASVGELVVHNLRAMSFDRNAFRSGMLGYLDSFEETYRDQLRMPIRGYQRAC